MKKAFFKLMLVVLGLNVFTACYGPAPGWSEEYPPESEVEQTQDTKAADTQAGEEESEEQAEGDVDPQS